VLEKIFAHKRNEIKGEWRRLHDEKLYDPYFSPDIIRVVRYEVKKNETDRACGMYGGEKRWVKGFGEET